MSKILGYKQLSQEQINLINEVKLNEVKLIERDVHLFVENLVKKCNTFDFSEDGNKLIAFNKALEYFEIAFMLLNKGISNPKHPLSLNSEEKK